MSELPGRTEVLVVGAGPVGLAVAALAHRLTRLATAPSAVRPLRNLALRLLSLVPAFRRRLASNSPPSVTAKREGGPEHL